MQDAIMNLIVKELCIIVIFLPPLIGFLFAMYRKKTHLPWHTLQHVVLQLRLLRVKFLLIPAALLIGLFFYRNLNPDLRFLITLSCFSLMLLWAIPPSVFYVGYTHLKSYTIFSKLRAVFFPLRVVAVLEMEDRMLSMMFDPNIGYDLKNNLWSLSVSRGKQSNYIMHYYLNMCEFVVADALGREPTSEDVLALASMANTRRIVLLTVEKETVRRMLFKDSPLLFFSNKSFFVESSIDEAITRLRNVS